MGACFLMRNAAMMRNSIRVSEDPEEALLSWRLSLIITIATTAAFAGAAWMFPRDWMWAVALVASPIFLVGLLVLYMGRHSRPSA